MSYWEPDLTHSSLVNLCAAYRIRIYTFGTNSFYISALFLQGGEVDLFVFDNEEDAKAELKRLQSILS